MKKYALSALALLGVALVVGGFIYRSAPTAGVPELDVHCAAGLKKPMELIAAEFLKDYGVQAKINYGGSSSLLSSIRISKKGDLLLAADQSTMDDAQRLGLVQEVIPVVIQKLVVAVAKGNPKEIQQLSDLLRDDVRLGLVNAESASAGKVARRVLGDDWERLLAKATVTKPTVTDLAGDLSLGTLDAAIIWDSTASQFKNLEAITIPQLASAQEVASIGVLTSAKDPARALQMARYLAAPETGGSILTATGFQPTGGDKWSEGERLLAHRRDQKERFEEAGFRWRGNGPTILSKDIEVPPWLKRPTGQFDDVQENRE